MCVLCRDTFSRSDILKRHFQKCSIRRGNPTGASHLSHAQAHLKKSHPGPHKPPASQTGEGDMMNNMNGIGGLSNDAMLHPFGISPDGRIPDAASNLTDEQATQNHLSRSNSLKRMSNGDGRDRRSMTGPGPGGSSRASFDQNYSGDIPATMSSAGMNPQLTAYNVPNGQAPYGQGFGYPNGNGNGIHPPGNPDLNGLANNRPAMPMYAGGNPGQSTNLDWSHMFQPGAQDGFINPFSATVGQTQMPIKTEAGLTNSPFPSGTDSHDGVYPGNIYTNGQTGPDTVPGAPSSFALWNFGSQSDPLQHTSDQLISFCFPQGSQPDSQSAALRSCLSADNVKHFLNEFTNFQGHFPILHTPSFRINETYEGLLLVMICIGAVYSDRINSTLVRELMELAKAMIDRSARVLAMVSRDQNGDIRFADGAIGNSKTDMEELQAVTLVQALFTWHGTPIQRETARRNFPVIASLARRAGLTQPSTLPQSYSVLHQPNVAIEHFNSANFEWNSWLEQEKRTRLLYGIFLIDTSMVMYFNVPPQLDSLEIRLPLPADDAAWDARTSTQCADALGLHGPVAARDRNPEGSRRPKQPEMHSALKALMHNVYDLQPGTTNLYSKFILVHALHVQIWNVQKQLSQDSGMHNGQGLAFPTSGTSTPLSQNDWVNRSQDNNTSAHGSTNGSGRGTPVGEGGQSPLNHQLLKATNNAIDKWKRAWDEDMAAQYPPSSQSYRRFGFCRDGVHFYWLAKYLLKNSRVVDWQMAPDQRFTQIINLLRLVKTWVVSDSSKRGEELGSVSDIDEEYGVSDLTLDMAQLFKPINKQIDSPVSGVHTNLGGSMI